MKYGKNVRRALITITQFGIDMMVPIALCSALGYFLDRKLGTSWIFVLMFFVGAVAGAWNVYRFARRISEDSGDVRHRDLAAGVTGDDRGDIPAEAADPADSTDD